MTLISPPMDIRQLHLQQVDFALTLAPEKPPRGRVPATRGVTFSVHPADWRDNAILEEILRIFFEFPQDRPGLTPGEKNKWLSRRQRLTSIGLYLLHNFFRLSDDVLQFADHVNQTHVPHSSIAAKQAFWSLQCLEGAFKELRPYIKEDCKTALQAWVFMLEEQANWVMTLPRERSTSTRETKKMKDALRDFKKGENPYQGREKELPRTFNVFEALLIGNKSFRRPKGRPARNESGVGQLFNDAFEHLIVAMGDAAKEGTNSKGRSLATYTFLLDGQEVYASGKGVVPVVRCYNSQYKNLPKL